MTHTADTTTLTHLEPAPHHEVAHLTPARIAEAHRRQAAKMLAELAHEQLVTPIPCEAGSDAWRVTSDDRRVTWTFDAHVLPLEHWAVDPDSIVRLVDEGDGPVEHPVDAELLVLDLREQMGLSDDVLPTYLEEISSTLAGRAWKLAHHTASAEELANADFQTLEAAMSEGHPCFLANNGRIGFSVADHAAYAPETGARVQLVWLACHRDDTDYAAVPELADQQDLLREELPAEQLESFARTLLSAGLDPADYLYLPCHPWQWRHKIAVTYATQVAARRIVPVGVSAEAYQPQQSLRTFYNVDTPRRRYVKTALSVLNMGFLRGLSPAYMRVTPAINTWVHELVRDDEELARLGFSVLREVAAIGYRHPAQNGVELAGGASQHAKMLAALWRESPVDRVGPGERLMTMAGLLHHDRYGGSLAAELVRASGLAPREWVRRYLEAYLVPVVHCFYRHRLVFMPHGENVILVLDGHVPVRAIMKDIGEEVGLLADPAPGSPGHPLPEDVRRIRADIVEDQQLLAIWSDVFDCFLRFLAAALDEAGTLPAEELWEEVGAVLRDYQAGHPELADLFERLDIFAPEFPRMCMNRLQLRNNQQMVDLADPSSALVLAGMLESPIAGSRATD